MSDKARYPSDVALVREIVSHLLRTPEPLPSGGFLTPHRFLQLGLCLGSGTGMEDLHYLLEDALLPSPTDPHEKVFSYKFLRYAIGLRHYGDRDLRSVHQCSVHVDVG